MLDAGYPIARDLWDTSFAGLTEPERASLLDLLERVIESDLRS